MSFCVPSITVYNETLCTPVSSTTTIEIVTMSPGPAEAGLTVNKLQAALPPPGEPLNDAATTLGVAVDELIAVLPPPPG